MINAASFAGFNFTNVWGFRNGENNNLPILRVFYQFSISLSQDGLYNFTPAAIAGYAPITPHSITITNDGNRPTGNLNIALSGLNSTNFIVTPASIASISPDETAVFTVEPKTGLPPGSHNATVTVSNSDVPAATFNVSFLVIPVPMAPHITTTSLPNGIFGILYDRVISVTGDSPITWTITEGSLPPGLTLNTALGRITGTPTEVGSFTFTVTATNATGNDTAELTITIDESVRALSVSPSAINFGKEPVGYNALPLRRVVITNTGNTETGVLSVSISGDDFSLAAAAPVTTTNIASILPGATAFFDVAPVTGLAMGDYAAAVTVENTNISPAAIINLSFAVSDFAPVTDITGVPTLAYAGVPLQMSGTAFPPTASNRDITWFISELDTNTARAYIDSAGVLVAERPGTVTVTAVVKNGTRNANGDIVDYTQPFVITVRAYAPNTLTLQANPGGSVMGGGSYNSGETVTISASAHTSAGWQFAGWHTNDGGFIADTMSATTQFTMPNNSVTIVAYFTFIGAPGGGTAGGSPGDVVLPNMEHYFTAGSAYVAGAGTPYELVVLRSHRLFRSVTLDGVTLTRNGHYSVSPTDSYTKITFANGYLDTLGHGTHTIAVQFSDNRTVTMVFMIIQSTPQIRVYDDVSPVNWFYTSVAFVSERGWMTSSTNDPLRFRPNDPVTQGDVVDALYRMAGSPTMLSMHGYPLQGRDASHQWALSKSILPLSGRYDLNGAVTRQDIAFLLDRLADVQNLRYRTTRSAPNFADEWSIHVSAREAVTNLYRSEIINGRTTETFVPLGNMTRAEFATVLHRFANAMRVR